MSDIVERLRETAVMFDMDGVDLGIALREAADTITSQAAEIAELRKDAERYRAFREITDMRAGPASARQLQDVLDAAIAASKSRQSRLQGEAIGEGCDDDTKCILGMPNDLGAVPFHLYCGDWRYGICLDHAKAL